MQDTQLQSECNELWNLPYPGFPKMDLKILRTASILPPLGKYPRSRKMYTKQFKLSKIPI